MVMVRVYTKRKPVSQSTNQFFTQLTLGKRLAGAQTLLYSGYRVSEKEVKEGGGLIRTSRE